MLSKFESYCFTQEQVRGILAVTDIFQHTWNDSDVNLPSKSMVPLNVSCFFDTKRDGTAMGACGGVTYQIVDKDSVIQGYGKILILEILYVVY